MNIETYRGVREGPIGGRIVVVAITSFVTVVMIVVLAVALAPARPPGSILTGTTWQWTGATTGSAGAPLVVPDPPKYTIEFMSDWTFRATADCNTVSGTYRDDPARADWAPVDGSPTPPGSLQPRFLRPRLPVRRVPAGTLVGQPGT